MWYIKLIGWAVQSLLGGQKDKTPRSEAPKAFSAAAFSSATRRVALSWTVRPLGRDTATRIWEPGGSFLPEGEAKTGLITTKEGKP